ncbi:hypothetical protein K0M31_014590 [Melipona bicolor]|uniref:Uncharacterized protein n=1 Tax=Melipona bicolor TaxID=60889 RepID=A0AA40FGW1_9HYME|nr:hypothetical protein K0M31_014590 [Melipona bicolor]
MEEDSSDNFQSVFTLKRHNTLIYFYATIKDEHTDNARNYYLPFVVIILHRITVGNILPQTAATCIEWASNEHLCDNSVLSY